MTGVDLQDLIKRFRAQRPFVRWFAFALLLTLMVQSVGTMVDLCDGLTRGFNDAAHGAAYRP